MKSPHNMMRPLPCFTMQMVCTLFWAVLVFYPKQPLNVGQTVKFWSGQSPFLHILLLKGQTANMTSKDFFSPLLNKGQASRLHDIIIVIRRTMIALDFRVTD